ncbi:Modulator of FtsH protease HflC [Limihaloglobus sulfuriphilus]|uniref:Protein HflC n=1 Tax=Limihaloglobus sulfuriphilus TaxID=1851148 RepID=A0A1Q2MCK8_9BACT|nr:protease modulator HflC [Limihaloglobus sulfuriphilus]AQQ69982.1 Modulator of FtsH protease HflC [Limihaloglobus sulfuriphilus]
MQNKLLITIAVIIFAAALLAKSFFYVVNEREQAVVTKFGEFKRAATTAGLHFKVPIIEDIRFFDKRILEWDGNPTQVPTLEKRYIWVDAFARWRIEDPLMFYQTLGNETLAHGKLDDVINSAVRNKISNQKLIETVRNTNREMLMKIDIEGERSQELTAVELGRAKLQQRIIEEASTSATKFGIEIVDIRIKRLNYVEQVRTRVYDRMIEERLRVAEKYRSEGEGEMMRIQGERENDEKRILSEAYRTSQEIKGKADAEAINIYADAYSNDPEFYSFLKTLDSYKENLGAKSTVILSTESEYFKYLNPEIMMSE